jgi:hypothetical protein
MVYSTGRSQPTISKSTSKSVIGLPNELTANSTATSLENSGANSTLTQAPDIREYATVTPHADKTTFTVIPTEGTTNPTTTPQEGTTDFTLTTDAVTANPTTTPQEGTANFTITTDAVTVNPPATPQEGKANFTITTDAVTVNPPATPQEGTVNFTLTTDAVTVHSSIPPTPLEGTGHHSSTNKPYATSPTDVTNSAAATGTNAIGHKHFPSKST